MIRYMVKNNIKLMSRSSINILLMIVMPLIVISVLSSAFTDLMKRYDESDITAGYVRENDAVNEKMIDALKEAAKDNGIILREYTRSDPAECMRNDDLNGFVVFDKDGYTVYRNSDEAEIGKVIAYFVNAFYEKAGTSIAGIDTDSIEIRVEHPAFKPSIESIDYYGIVEVVFFLWCAIVCGSGIFMSEKKYQIIKKYQVSNLSSTKLYLGKFIPLVSAVFAGGIISTVLSIVLLGVHWGRPLLSLIIILLTTGRIYDLEYKDSVYKSCNLISLALCRYSLRSSMALAHSPLNSSLTSRSIFHRPFDSRRSTIIPNVRLLMSSAGIKRDVSPFSSPLISINSLASISSYSRSFTIRMGIFVSERNS